MKNTKPELRFAGFTDDWEQRKLGELAEIKTGGTPSTTVTDYWNPKEIPWLSSGEVNKKHIFSTDDKISKHGLEHSSATWISEKSVLIALAGQGKTRGTVAVNEIPLTTNQSIAGIEVNKGLDYLFLFSNLDGKYNDLRMASSGDGTRGGLNKQLLSEYEIRKPITLEEQQRIGTFFRTLDSAITLHQREVEKLTKLKKALLSKMFI